jgi:acetyl-CoA acetyltransferase
VTPARTAIVGVGESRYLRRPGTDLTTPALIADAARLALDDAGLTPGEIDGLAMASFSLAPDHAIDLAVALGLRVRWLMDAATGGASAVDMLQHARRALEAGDAQAVLLVAGDVLRPADFRRLVDEYNVATRELLAPIPHGGPNSLFALLTQRQMSAEGLTREDYGRLVVAQRGWAAGNPNAAYREPLSLEDYLAAPVVCEPLSILDCPPVVAGADALVLSGSADGVRVRAVGVLHNADRHDGDGLSTGLAEIAGELWDAAGAGPAEIGVASVYDDYPAMVVAQLVDLGFGGAGDVVRRAGSRELPVNTSGGQLSAGQAGAAGGMHGVVEVVRQLRGRAGRRQVDGARLGLVTGYGMVAYRYGACANAVVLEAP